MSGLYEVITWMIYALAAIVMLAVTVAAILAGIGLGFVADFLRELTADREGNDVPTKEQDNVLEQ